MRLSKVAKALNVGISKIVNHLAAKDIKIEGRPNTKISKESFEILQKDLKRNNKLRIYDVVKNHDFDIELIYDVLEANGIDINREKPNSIVAKRINHDLYDKIISDLNNYDNKSILKDHSENNSINKYINARERFNKFILEKSAESRQNENKKEAIEIVKEKQLANENLLKDIREYKYSLSEVKLKLSEFTDFLNSKEFIEITTKQKKSFKLFNRSISNENKKIEEKYNTIYLEAWDDYIITQEEREKLDEFCSINNISRAKQKVLENNVKEKLNHKVDIDSLIKYYKSLNFSSVKIQNIVNLEYKIQIEVSEIDKITTKNEQKNKIIKFNYGNIPYYIEILKDNNQDKQFLSDEKDGIIYIQISNLIYKEYSNNDLINMVIDAVTMQMAPADLDDFFSSKHLVGNKIRKLNLKIK